MSENKNFGKALYETLKDHGLLQYGSSIPRELVFEVCEIVVPKLADRETFSSIALRELGATDHVRGVLLNEGKYLKGTPSGYRILLPSENSVQVESYMRGADAKLRRGMKLSKNTPAGADAFENDQLAARMLMKREAIKAQRKLDNLGKSKSKGKKKTPPPAKPPTSPGAPLVH